MLGDELAFEWDWMAQVSFRRLLELAQNHRGDLGRSVVLAADVHFDELIGTAHDLVQDEFFFARSGAVP
jgi:hypothetical protein